jgi:hypothetical protein
MVFYGIAPDPLEVPIKTICIVMLFYNVKMIYMVSYALPPDPLEV